MKHEEKLLEDFKAKKAREQKGMNEKRITGGRDEACLKSTTVRVMFAKKVSNLVCADDGSGPSKK